MKNKDTWKPSIYKIDLENIGLHKCKNYNDRKKALNKILSLKKFNIQEIKKNFEGYEFFLFYKKNEKKESDWKKFLSPISDFKKLKNNFQENFILFVFICKEQEMYAICGGYVFSVIESFIINNFGLEILSRIIDNENEQTIGKAKEISVTSSILRISKIFREKFSLLENQNFGSIYQTLQISNQTIKREFGLESSRKNITSIGASSFIINQLITFEKFLDIINKCSQILKREPRVTINALYELKKEEIKTLKLEELLYKKFLDSFNKKEFNEFYLSHKNFDDFHNANSYKIGKTVYEDESDLLNEFSERYEPKTPESFKNVQIKVLNSDGNEIFSSKLIKCLITEIQLKNKCYFYVLGDWFLLKDNFLEDLNKKCEIFIKENINNGLKELWEIKNGKLIPEQDYNQLYKSKENFVVLDRVTIQRIEPCDILKYDRRNNKIYLYYIKQGFDNSMRILKSQIYIAAKRIQESIKSDSELNKNNPDKEYIKELYEKIERKIDLQFNEFKTLFNENNLIFVLAFVDKAKFQRDILKLAESGTLNSFESNIAKFCLAELIVLMKNLNFKLEIAQIKKKKFIGNTPNTKEIIK